METRITIKRNHNKKSNYYVLVFEKNKSIIVNFIRLILPTDDIFTCRINGKDLYLGMVEGGDSGPEIINPEWDELEKYYYYDVKFYKDIRIRNISITVNTVEPKTLDGDIYLEYDSEYKKLDNPLIDIEREEIEEKQYYIVIKNDSNDESFDRELLYVNGLDDFKLERIGRDLYKLSVEDFEISYLEWDTTDEELDNGAIYFVYSELPITNFPNQLKYKDYYDELNHKKSIKNLF